MNSQKGNVLFLILIAVALFAALSYAVTQSTRGGGKSDTSGESAELKASQYLQYGAALKLAVDRMIISGTAPEDIVVHGANAGVACTAGTVNCVFGPSGGGAVEVQYQYDPTIDKYTLMFEYDGVAESKYVDGVGTSGPEIMMQRSFQQNDKGQKLCAALNKGAGIVGIPYQGPYVPATHNAILGAPVLCYQYGTSEYMFYYVLHGT